MLKGELMDDLSDKRALCTLFSSAFYWASLFLAYWSSSVVVEEPLAFRLKGCALLGSAVMLVVWFLVMRSGKGKVFDGPVLMVLPFVLSPMAGISALLLAFPVGGLASVRYPLCVVVSVRLRCGFRLDSYGLRRFSNQTRERFSAPRIFDAAELLHRHICMHAARPVLAGNHLRSRASGSRILALDCRMQAEGPRC